jgi:hypothetical protein
LRHYMTYLNVETNKTFETNDNLLVLTINHGGSEN